MIRIVCPHCHAPLSTAELEQATINGQLSLLCPECAAVLVADIRFQVEQVPIPGIGQPPLLEHVAPVLPTPER